MTATQARPEEWRKGGEVDHRGAGQFEIPVHPRELPQYRRHRGCAPHMMTPRGVRAPRVRTGTKILTGDLRRDCLAREEFLADPAD